MSDAIDQYWTVPELRERMIAKVADETPYVHRDGPCTVELAVLADVASAARDGLDSMADAAAHDDLSDALDRLEEVRRD